MESKNSVKRIAPQVMPLEFAEALVRDIIQKNNLAEYARNFLLNSLRTSPIIQIEGNDYVRADLVRGYISNVYRSAKNKDQSLLFQRRGLKVTKPASIEEFALSSDYLNLSGSVRPAIMRQLKSFFQSKNCYVEAVLTGGIGIGKGFFANIGLCYCLYLLSCLQNPQVEYDLQPGSSIYFIIQSKTETLAKKAVFNELVETIKASKYFQNNFMFDKAVTSELRFPNNIYVTPFGGSDSSCLSGDALIPDVNGILHRIDECLNKDIKPLTYDEKKGIIPSENFVHAVCNGERNVVKLHFSDGSSIVCTEDHKFMTSEGWYYVRDCVSKIFINVQDLYCNKDNSEFYNEKSNESNNFSGIKPEISKVCVQAEQLPEKTLVYDLINVKPNHNFLVKAGNSFIVAHNCLGLNVVGGIIDELNFMTRTEDSVHVRFTGEDEYDQAERIYNTIVRRMKSRFQTFGRLPGKLFLLSSVNYPDDFTDRKVKEAANDKTIFVMKLSQWESIPEERFSGEKFKVIIGNEFKVSKVVECDDEILEGDTVIDVPIEYKAEFEKDCDGALKDFAGVTTATTHPFIPYRAEIKECQDQFANLYGKGLFKREVVDFSLIIGDSSFDYDELVDLDYLDSLLGVEGFVFAAHVDLGISGDKAGLSIGHVGGYILGEPVKYFNARQNRFVEKNNRSVPIIVIDGALQITAKRGGEVDVQKIENLILYLREKLFLKYFTADGFQSVQILQNVKKAGIRVGTLSVDTSFDPYVTVKTAIKDKRFLFHHSIMSRELRELEKDDKKIDHRPGGSKDVADSGAAVTSILMQKAMDTVSSARSRRNIDSGGRVTKRVDTKLRRLRIGG